MLKRRDFLTAATSLTALPWLASQAAAGRLASERITVGLIGAGTMGRGHLGRLLGNPDVEVLAVSDVVDDRLENAASMVTERYAERTKSGSYHGVQKFADFRELLALKGLDAVVIATPDHWHAVGCILAARAGKHVYCEKPLTHNIAEGRLLVDEVAKAQIVFQTGSQQRSEFGGHFRRAVEAVWNGVIGEVKRVRIGVGGPAKPCDLPTQDIPVGTNWDMWVGPAPMRGYNDVLCPQGVHKHFPQWRAYQEFAGGGLADMGAHHFDIAQWALDMDRSGPIKIIPPTDTGAETGLTLVYANGVEMIHGVFEEGIKADCVFEGSQGTILVSRSGISSSPGGLLEQPLPENARRVQASNNHQQNWLAAIRSGAPTICPAEVGHRSASICHLANIGYRLRRELRWDPLTERFAADAAANDLLARTPRAPWAV